MRLKPDKMPGCPAWFTVLLLLAGAVVFSFPAMLSNCPQGETFFQWLLWSYPMVMIAAGVLAAYSYRERPAVGVMLLVFMVLIDASMLYLYLFNHVSNMP